ncbi:hypothetical protein G843_04824, partial [Escherichia coli HVH 191 (3-9341900)]
SVQKGEQVKTANFLIQKTVNGTRNFFESREALAGFGAQSRYCYIFNAPYLDHVRYYVMPP